jgi:hypothetical protein
MTSRLTVHKENLPTRCEICHQSDQFDQVSGRCQRCAQVMLMPAAAQALAQNSDPRTIASVRAVAAAIFGIFAFFPGLCLGPVGVLFGVASIVLGKMELNDIRQGRSAPAGESYAYVAICFGIIGGLLSLFFSLPWLGYMMRFS